jgi:hypothetical protein
MSIIDNAKEVTELVKKYNDIELYRKIKIQGTQQGDHGDFGRVLQGMQKKINFFSRGG